MEEIYNELMNNMDSLSIDQISEIIGKSLFVLNKKLNEEENFQYRKLVNGTIDNHNVDISIFDDDYNKSTGIEYNQSNKLGYWE